MTPFERDHVMAQLGSFFCGLRYLSTNTFPSEGVPGGLPWFFKNGVMADVQHCFQWAGMA